MRVGFIGLGRMGFPMARNLIRAGHEVVAHNRSRGPVDRLAALGAVPAASAADVARAVDAVVSCVLTPEQVEDVYLGPGGVRDGVRAGVVCIDTSTIHPGTSRAIGAALRDHDVAFLDAPVSGGPHGADSGTLSVMVGGDAAVLERVRPILDVFGTNIYHMGPVGAGCSAKLCNQLLTGTAHVLVAEAMVLGVKLGLDPHQLCDVLHASSGQCRALDRAVPEAILPRNFAAVYTVDGMIKDLECALRSARENGVRLLLPTVAQQIYQEAHGLGHGGKHLAAVIMPMEDIAGVVVSATSNAPALTCGRSTPRTV